MHLVYMPRFAIMGTGLGRLGRLFGWILLVIVQPESCSCCLFQNLNVRWKSWTTCRPFSKIQKKIKQFFPKGNITNTYQVGKIQLYLYHISPFPNSLLTFFNTKTIPSQCSFIIPLHHLPSVLLFFPKLWNYLLLLNSILSLLNSRQHVSN